MNDSNKYSPGEFGYWWTVTMKRKDIEGLDYEGDLCPIGKGLTSLRGAPRSVGRDFCCNNNKLTSLEHCPENVGGSFWCQDNEITGLEHCPKKVGASFWCHRNKLISLEFCPENILGDFWCNDNHLASLAHGPHKVSCRFECEDNNLAEPLLELITNNIVARNYVVTEDSVVSFKELETEKRKMAISRQLGPFAITTTRSKL